MERTVLSDLCSVVNVKFFVCVLSLVQRRECGRCIAPRACV